LSAATIDLFRLRRMIELCSAVSSFLLHCPKDATAAQLLPLLEKYYAAARAGREAADREQRQERHRPS
jgi:hypothetical protein